MSAIRARVAELLREMQAKWTGAPSMDDLNGVLRLVAKWRAHGLAETYFVRHGDTIYAGPFQGMSYVRSASEGALLPRLFGTYESELHPHLEALAQIGLDCV